MSRFLRRAAACAAAGIASAACAAEPMNVRTGTWEMTVTNTTSGTLSKEALARIPADKRAMVERMMAARDGKPTTTTRKTCVSAEDLARDPFVKNDVPGCTNEVVTRTPTKLAARQVCRGSIPSTGTISVEAPTPESMIGTIDHDRGDGARVHVDIAGKWLAANCDDVPTPGTRPLYPPQ